MHDGALALTPHEHLADYEEEDARKVLGGNLLRVWRRVWGE